MFDVVNVLKVETTAKDNKSVYVTACVMSVSHTGNIPLIQCTIGT